MEEKKKKRFHQESQKELNKNSDKCYFFSIEKETEVSQKRTKDRGLVFLSRGHVMKRGRVLPNCRARTGSTSSSQSLSFECRVRANP